MASQRKTCSLARPLRRSQGSVLLVAALLLASHACAGPRRGTTVEPAASTPLPNGADPSDEPANDNAANDDPKVTFGSLPESINFYRTHGGDLYDAVKDAPWHGWKRVRKCSDCDDGKTRLVIQAIGNAQTEPITGFEGEALVRGRVINIGHGKDATLKIPAQNGFFTERDEYYYIITDDHSKTSATLWVARVSFSWPFHHPHNDVDIQKAQRKYTRCGHEDDIERTKSEGDFSTCDKSTRDVSLDQAWFSCDGGCCSAAWPP